MLPYLHIFRKSNKYLHYFCRKSTNFFSRIFVGKKTAHILGLCKVLRLFHVWPEGKLTHINSYVGYTKQ